jgi:hypothetical protein
MLEERRRAIETVEFIDRFKALEQNLLNREQEGGAK